MYTTVTLLMLTVLGTQPPAQHSGTALAGGLDVTITDPYQCGLRHTWTNPNADDMWVLWRYCSETLSPQGLQQDCRNSKTHTELVPAGGSVTWARGCDNTPTRNCHSDNGMLPTQVMVCHDLDGLLDQCETVFTCGPVRNPLSPEGLLAPDLSHRWQQVAPNRYQQARSIPPITNPGVIYVGNDSPNVAKGCHDQLTIVNEGDDIVVLKRTLCTYAGPEQYVCHDDVYCVEPGAIVYWTWHGDNCSTKGDVTCLDYLHLPNKVALCSDVHGETCTDIYLCDPYGMLP